MSAPDERKLREFEEKTYRDGMAIFNEAPADWEILHYPDNQPPAVVVRHLPSGHEVPATGHPNPDILIAAAVLMIWEEKLKRPRSQVSPSEQRLPAKVFDHFLSRSYLPLFDDMAGALGYMESYKRAKGLKKCWPRLLRMTCRALWLANHDNIPVTYGELAQAQLAHHLAMTKREGRAAPNFAARQVYLRATGNKDLAVKAANAAKNLPRTLGEWDTRNGVPHWVPRDGLRERLPLFWLPALLWTMDDNGVHDALPFLRNRIGETVGEIETGTPRAIQTMRLELKLPTAIQLFGEPIAKFDNGVGRPVFKRGCGLDEA